MKPVVLALCHMPDAHQARIAEYCELIYAFGHDVRREAIAEHGARVDVLLSNGVTGLTADEVAAMPKLALACALGAGYESFDIAALRGRGIPLTNGAGTNDRSVADHAFALLLAVIRDVPALDRLTRAGVWRTDIDIKPGVSGKRLGILGLGTIGRHIAKRAEAFDMPVGYHNRSVRHDAPFEYFDSADKLARWADILVVATPGGPQTRHLVGAAVLDALGPQGYLINIARGSVVDTEALAAALHARTLGGAGLDVYESEPAPPAVLLDCPNVVLTPHVAGWSPEAIDATVECFLDNVTRWAAGKPLVNLVA